MFKITVNTKEMDEAFKKLTGDTTGLMSDIAGILVSSADQAFIDEKDPVTGEAWQPLSEAYAAKKKAEGYSDKILEKDGYLNKIQSDSNATEALAGSNLVYAAAQNLGYEERNLPARRFLGIDDIAEEDILDAIHKHYQSALE